MTFMMIALKTYFRRDDRYFIVEFAVLIDGNATFAVAQGMAM